MFAVLFCRGMAMLMIVKLKMQQLPKIILPLIASSLALLILASAAHAQNPVRRGRALLNEFCANCHAIGKTGNSRMREAPPLRTLGRSFELDDFAQDLRRGILSGHPDMPKFKFSEDDARAVTAYLRSIQQ
jgi:mono/diheme cytochrome c family protein